MGIPVGAAVYTTILTNEANKWIARLVPAAVVKAGVPPANVEALIQVLGTPALAANYSKAVVAAVGAATEQAYVHGIGYGVHQRRVLC